MGWKPIPRPKPRGLHYAGSVTVHSAEELKQRFARVGVDLRAAGIDAAELFGPPPAPEPDRGVLVELAGIWGGVWPFFCGLARETVDDLRLAVVMLLLPGVPSESRGPG